MKKTTIRSIGLLLAIALAVGVFASTCGERARALAADPTSSPPPTAPMDDPLYQAIIGELRGARQPLDGESDKKSKTLQPASEDKGLESSAMTRDDWRAVELMLRAARLLEKEKPSAKADGSKEPDQHRAELAKLLRSKAGQFVKSR